MEPSWAMPPVWPRTFPKFSSTEAEQPEAGRYRPDAEYALAKMVPDRMRGLTDSRLMSAMYGEAPKQVEPRATTAPLNIRRDDDCIWRLQDRCGEGAYRRYASGEGSYAGYEHPAPDEAEGIPRHAVKQAHRFGFANLMLARRWWYSLPDLIDWEQRGAVIAVYARAHCTDVIDGRHQTVFIPHAAAPLMVPASALHTSRIADLVAQAAAHFTTV